MRPANIITAIADVLAGISISGFCNIGIFDNTTVFSIALLCVSTAGLYGGGVVFNDVFDIELDKAERPERPIPSGTISVNEATALGSSLLLAGLSTAFVVNIIAGTLAILISTAALVYNKWGKHHSLLGPVNMGMCRGLNLLLGISIMPAVIENFWMVTLVPLIYISSITMISRGEVHGSKRSPLYFGTILYTLVIGSVVYFSGVNNTLFLTVLFLLPFIWMIYKPLIKAIQYPSGTNIGRSVKAGVIGIILLDTAWAASSGAFAMALVIFILLPISFGLSRAFAVT